MDGWHPFAGWCSEVLAAHAVSACLLIIIIFGSDKFDNLIRADFRFSIKTEKSTSFPMKDSNFILYRVFLRISY